MWFCFLWYLQFKTVNLRQPYNFKVYFKTKSGQSHTALLSSACASELILALWLALLHKAVMEYGITVIVKGVTDGPLGGLYSVLIPNHILLQLLGPCISCWYVYDFLSVQKSHSWTFHHVFFKPHNFSWVLKFPLPQRLNLIINIFILNKTIHII